VRLAGKIFLFNDFNSFNIPWNTMEQGSGHAYAGPDYANENNKNVLTEKVY